MFGLASRQLVAAARFAINPEQSPPVERGAGAPPIPPYLKDVYWWAYVHPAAVDVFERQWLVNLILWGNYRRLREEAFVSLGENLAGRTLQVACAYGDFTARLAARIKESGGSLDVVDVLPIQLGNLRAKLPPDAPVRLLNMDAGDLRVAEASYDRAVLFFLLHEQPEDHRRRTLAEALRVTKPGGKIVIVDYARPRWWNPLRWLFRPILASLEPYALDLWRESLCQWTPHPWKEAPKAQSSYFGGLYQKIVISR